MKKIMGISALICLAAFNIQAASIQWSLGNNSLKNLTGTANQSGAALQLIAVASTVDLDAYIASGLTTTTGINFIDTNGTGTTAGLGNMALKTASDPALVDQSSYNFYVVAQYTFSGTPYFMVSSKITQKAYAAPSPATKVEYATANFGAGSYTAALPTDINGWQAIPEPTSLALLAIGVAAIGLRRKFRK